MFLVLVSELNLRSLRIICDQKAKRNSSLITTRLNIRYTLGYKQMKACIESTVDLNAKQKLLNKYFTQTNG